MSSEERYLTCDCEKCGNSISFPDHGLGMTIDCPHCSAKTVLLPAPPPDPPAPAFCRNLPTHVDSISPTVKTPSGPRNSLAPQANSREVPKSSGTTGRSVHRYSPHGMVKPVNFYFLSGEAQSVAVLGDFNDWSPTAHPMRKQPDGRWFAQIDLSHGHHAYLLMVDDKLMLDPQASGITRNARGERVSLRAVS